MTLIDPAAAHRLRSTDFGWITTVRPDGQPQSSYVWFHCDSTDILVISPPQSRKVRSIAENPKVSFHLDGDGTAGDGVLTIDATAELSADGPGQERLAAYLAKYEHRIRENLHSTPEQYAADFSTAIRVTPNRIRAW